VDRSGTPPTCSAVRALVMLMTPGLALFYGGMVRAKSVLNMMMMSIVCLGVIGLVWVRRSGSRSPSVTRTAG
jgi:ammonia channel protein AmtB